MLFEFRQCLGREELRNNIIQRNRAIKDVWSTPVVLCMISVWEPLCARGRARSLHLICGQAEPLPRNTRAKDYHRAVQNDEDTSPFQNLNGFHRY